MDKSLKANLVYAAEQFNYEGLHKALEQLSEFEKRANLRVIDSGVLKGLNVEDIKRAGERLLFQDGCTSFFRSVTRNEKLNTDIHVLSYCWCGDLIRSAFSSGEFFSSQKLELLYSHKAITYGFHLFD